MARVYVFADEAGNFDFSLKNGASKHFILGTVTLNDPALGEQILRLRRELAWKGLSLDSEFHASTDDQLVRDAVFGVLTKADFRFDATVFEKRKAMPHLRPDEYRFYKYIWYYHFKYVAPRILTRTDELLVIVSQIGTKKKRAIFRAALEDVVIQTAACLRWQVAFWANKSDPCLQIADYCTWAVQRKHEKGDARSYDLIRTKIRTDFNAFARGSTYYY